MTDEEKKLVFTPDGSFLEDEATLAKKDRQKYLDRISSSSDTNFLSCQICGGEVDEVEDLCCTSCPRSFHKKCLSALQSSDGGSATECTCINDHVIHQEEEIRPIVLSKLDSAYNHLSGMKSYNTCIITLGMLYQIVARLKDHTYGSIFFNAVNTQLVTDYLAVSARCLTSFCCSTLYLTLLHSSLMYLFISDGSRADVLPTDLASIGKWGVCWR